MFGGNKDLLLRSQTIMLKENALLELLEAQREAAASS